MSDTPRTDAAPIHTHEIYVRGCNGIPLNQQWVHVDFARQLERELNESKAQNEESVKLYVECNRRANHAESKCADLHRELDALKSEQMTEEKARDVLGLSIINEINSLNSNDPFIVYYTAQSDPKKAMLDGLYTSLQLHSIAWWMDNKGGNNHE